MGVNETIISDKLNPLQAEMFKEFFARLLLSIKVIPALLKMISMDALQSFCEVPKIRKSQITAFFVSIELILIMYFSKGTTYIGLSYGVELHLDRRKYGCLASGLIGPVSTSFAVLVLGFLGVCISASLSFCNHSLRNFALVPKLCV